MYVDGQIPVSAGAVHLGQIRTQSQPDGACQADNVADRRQHKRLGQTPYTKEIAVNRSTCCCTSAPATATDTPAVFNAASALLLQLFLHPSPLLLLLRRLLGLRLCRLCTQRLQRPSQVCICS